MAAKVEKTKKGSIARDGVGVEAERARRYEAHLSVLLINVDGLGLVNGLVGRKCGDALLAEIAGIVRNNIRKIDVFGRWDAEDFVILTVDRNSFGSIALAEKLRRAIADQAFEVEGKPVRVTVSIGVARGRPGDEQEIDGLIGAARSAVVRAKAAGRNRVEYADGGSAAIAVPDLAEPAE